MSHVPLQKQSRLLFLFFPLLSALSWKSFDILQPNIILIFCTQTTSHIFQRIIGEHHESTTHESREKNPPQALQRKTEGTRQRSQEGQEKIRQRPWQWTGRERRLERKTVILK